VSTFLDAHEKKDMKQVINTTKKDFVVSMRLIISANVMRLYAVQEFIFYRFHPCIEAK
jgi:hypothetical protein